MVWSFDEWKIILFSENPKSCSLYKGIIHDSLKEGTSLFTFFIYIICDFIPLYPQSVSLSLSGTINSWLA